MNTRLMIAGSARVVTRYRLRSAGMGLGIVVGVAALVVMRSMGAGAEQEMMEKIERMFSASSVMIVNSGHFRGGSARRPGRLTLEDIEAIDAQLEEVTDHDGMVVAGNREVQRGGRSLNLTIFGHSDRAAAVWNRGVTRGEFFTGDEVRSMARVALLGEKTAEELFGDEDPVGQRIDIGGAPFRVKGVLDPYGMDPHGLDRDDEVHVPITTLMRRMVNVDTIGSAKLIVASTERMDDTVEEIATILRQRHDLADDAPEDFTIFTPTLVQEAVREANRVVTIYLPATAGIALLVAGLVIANVMLMGVRERRREIGLRKALGATPAQIGWQFLLESLAVTTVSAAAGAALGAGVLMLVAAHGAQARVQADAIVVGCLAALIVGGLAGFLPARRAARLEAVDALR